MTYNSNTPDGYDGNTAAGGPAQTRLTEQLEITKMAVGPMDNNSYLLRDRATGTTLLIDAANEPDRLVELCGPKLDAILTTHSHLDHWLALEQVVAATGATTYASADEAPSILIPTDVAVDDGDTIELGETTLTAIKLFGHKSGYSDHVCGSIAIIHHDVDGSTHAWTGDCLFPDGVGNTAGDATAFAALLGDVEAKLFTNLPDDTWIYPGHGKDTTIGAERPHLDEWAQRGW